MKTTVLAGLAGSLIVASAATASFSWGANSYEATAAGGQAVSVMDLYVTFDGPTSIVNVFNVNFTLSEGLSYFHNDLLDGTWNPQFSAPFGSGTNSIDTFVTFNGLQSGFAADGNWPGSFDVIDMPVDAGWFMAGGTNAPTSAQGGFENAIWVARVVIETGGAADDSLAIWTLTVSGELTEQTGAQSGAEGQFKFAGSPLIPAPGALALLGLAGLAGSRRRRA